ncbi:MAG: ABC transporter substrate-binding protein [Fimbriimonadales bacterium]|nr:ABC transporter substrate-binding protein [Fimbriimonadales bacterium]
MKLHLGMMVAASLALAVGCSGGKDQDAGQEGAGAKSGKKIVVGFSQIGAESGWRTANTESIKSEAAKRGIELRFSDAQQKQENQIKALRSFIAQKVDVIMFSPVVEAGWGPVMKEIKDAGIPVIVADRRPDVGEDMYVTFIGSDFVEEGRRAARWLAKKMNGKANILELQGTPGSAPAIDRKKGFEEVLREHPGMKIVLSQSGDFTRAKGKEAMEAFLKSPVGRTANALFAHNDDMALGAIQAIEEAGLKPGKDIIIVSIDGVRGAFEAMIAGKLNCTVECNPIIGPQLFDAVEAVVAGKPLPKRIVVDEGVFDQSVAAKELPNRKY